MFRKVSGKNIYIKSLTIISDATKAKSLNWTKSFCNSATKPINDILSDRHAEASRSIIVQTHSIKSYDKIYKNCTQFGSIKKAFHFRTKTTAKEHNILIEYNAENSAKSILKSTNCLNTKCIQLTNIELKNDLILCENIPLLATTDGCYMPNDSEMHQLLMKQQSVDDQINTLYRRMHINELNTRLRFLVAAQINEFVQNLWSNLQVQTHPFGSSVNGFGRMDSDLDIILLAIPEPFTYSPEKYQQLCRREKRKIVKDHLYKLSKYMRKHAQDISQLQSILSARVPIIKYYDNCFNLDVDLCMNEMSGIDMSKLLYLFGEIDQRVRPLVFCIRHWAKHAKIIKPYPAWSLSNFGLTCLTIFFLQQLKQPILPSINYLNTIFPDNCSTMDSKDLNFKTKNIESVSTLLCQFFNYYSNFDFLSNGMSLHTGKVIEKEEKELGIYVANPIDSNINATKNVNARNCRELQEKMIGACYILENQLLTQNISQNKHWGIIPLFMLGDKTKKKGPFNKKKC